MVSEGPAGLPACPRRITPRDFAIEYYPRLVRALQPETPALPMAAAAEFEVEGEGGGVFCVAVDEQGSVAVTEEECPSSPWVTVVLDRPAFDAGVEVLQRWLRQRAKADDLNQLQGWLEQQSDSSVRGMVSVRDAINAHPGVIELHIRDDVGDVHVVTVEVGEPAEADPFLRIRLALEDLPLNPHTQSSAALEALARAKVRLEGDADYISHFSSLMR